MTAADPALDPASATVDALRSRGWTLATSESLTAGLLASTVARIPGASDVLRGGLIVYATDLKTSLAGVPGAVLSRHGAVSGETARALADGAAGRCGATVGIGLTGVAGPAEQEGHPVGTVYIGVRMPGAGTWSVPVSLTGDRQQIRDAACSAALEQILLRLGDGPGNESGR